MKCRQRTFRLASALLWSAGLAAAQTPTPPPTPTEAPSTGAIPVDQPPTGQPARGGRRGEEEIVVTGSRVRRKDLTTLRL